MAESHRFTVVLELDDEIMEIVAKRPPGMSENEFINWIVPFGAYQYRDGQQQDKLDWRVRQMNQRMAECYQQETGAVVQDNVAPSSTGDFGPRMKGL